LNAFITTFYWPEHEKQFLSIEITDLVGKFIPECEDIPPFNSSELSIEIPVI